jgi:uncharacterized protein (TIGR01777 family)
MHVAVSGASGLIGSALAHLLSRDGHRVIRLVRGGTGGKEDPSRVNWDPGTGIDDAARLEGLDAVVHLAGENIASGRWSAARKAEIRRSRVDGTRRLAESLANFSNPPKVLVGASAIGFYGDRGDERLDEESSAGSGFLPDLCQEWEAATEPAAAAGMRVVHLRFGVVLTPAGGALKQMLPPFQFGVGGKLGSGSQFMSWISLDDAVGSILHALRTESLAGPVNSVAPAPVTNAEFTRVLARVLGRPAIFPVPGFAARLAFGELADALLLASARVIPARLSESGYRFRHPELEDALRFLLGREATTG